MHQKRPSACKELFLVGSGAPKGARPQVAGKLGCPFWGALGWTGKGCHKVFGARRELGVLGLRATEKKLLLAVPSGRSEPKLGAGCWVLHADAEVKPGIMACMSPRRGLHMLDMHAHANAKMCVPG